jgi:hypothetical protein
MKHVQGMIEQLTGEYRRNSRPNEYLVYRCRSLDDLWSCRRSKRTIGIVPFEPIRTSSTVR